MTSSDLPQEEHRVCFEDDPQRLLRVCGYLDEHLKYIQKHWDVQITRRGPALLCRGGYALQSCRLLEDLWCQSFDQDLSLEDVRLSMLSLERMGVMPREISWEEHSEFVLRTRKGKLRGRSPRQNAYLRAMSQHDVCFAIGPAGTGKTHLAVACAVDALERSLVERLILVRPAVEAGEKLGFLPGDLAQKVDPYLRPLYDALYDFLGVEHVARLFEQQVIEIAPLAYMRGRTLNQAFIILDEAQNTTSEQMKMFLTRLGFGSKMVITGDLTQVDLVRHQCSGLREIIQVLSDIPEISFQYFDQHDIVRHPLVQRIVDAYERQTS